MPTESARRYRVGVHVTHPIQYLSPWFRRLSASVDLTVYYAHRQTAADQARAGFGVAFDWDTELLGGYDARWLTNVARRPGVDHFNGCDTPEIRDVIATGGFDAFLVFGWNHLSSIQSVWAARRARVPVFMRGDSQLETRRSLLKRAIKYLPYRLLLSKVNAHLTVGSRNEAYLRHYGVAREKLIRVPHAIDTAFFATGAARARAAGERQRLRAGLGIPDDAFVFLFVGKMIPKKRPADLIDAMRQVRTRSAKAHGLFIGDGPLRAELEGAASGDSAIHFAGFQNQAVLPAWYSSADALVLPSDARETWGLVVNEAAASGLPAVISEAAGCAPDLADGELTGVTYPVGDTARLAEQMLRLMQSWSSHRARAAQALAAQVNSFSLETTSRLFLDAVSRGATLP